MYLNNNPSPFAGLVKVVIALIVIGVLIGAALASTDVLNFITNSEKAQAQSAKDAVDLKYYTIMKENEVKDEVARSIMDTQLYAEKARQDQEFSNAVRYAFLLIGVLVILAFLVVTATLILRSKNASQKTDETEDVTADPSMLEMQIKLARQQEILNRLADLAAAKADGKSHEVVRKHAPRAASPVTLSEN